MSATEAKWAYGTTISRDGNVIALVKNIGDFSGVRAMIDATNLTSPDGHDEKVPGRKSTNDLQISGDLLPSDTTGQVGLIDDYEDGNLQEYVLTFPDALGTTLTFNAYVSQFGTSGVNADGLVGFTATLSVSGKPTWGITESTGLTTPFFAISESAVVVPTAANATYEYVATVLTGIASVTVTPTATAGTITVNGTEVTTGEASDAITLGAAGTVTEITIVVREDDKAAVTYTIWVARAAS